MEVSGEIMVERPIDEVFSAWAALERAHEFADPVIERVKETEGPLGPGTRFHAVDQWPGRKVEFTVEVTAYEPPNRMAATWSEPMTGGWDAIFEEVEGGTELRFESTMSPSGLMGLASPLLKPWVNRQTKSFLASFKEWVESGQAVTG